MDRFVLSRLELQRLAPSPEADRIEWLRRVSFDLTGLPPSLDEVRQFTSDESDQAYEKVVDRLLASAHFGERWAAMWMDLARYADSQGYEKDNLRTMWPYRDWVIQAFNADMPFDQFTIRQIAGDLLPDATLDDLIATAFHRNTPTNSEGGTDDEEFRLAAVIDRVDTTWEVWQGITFKCVQCHSHPYAPIENGEFYRFLAFFNTSRDWDLTNDVPKLHVPLNRSEIKRARQIDLRLAELQREEVTKTDALAEQATWNPLTPVNVSSTGQTQLITKPSEGGNTDILTEGTVSHDSRFTLDFTIPSGVSRLTALRIDVLPRNLEKAIHTPELGFVISEILAEIPQDEPMSQDEEEEGKAKEDQLVARTTDSTATDTAATDDSATDGAATDDADQGETKSVDKESADEGTKLPKGKAIDFAYALGDEAVAFAPAQSSLNPDKAGWGAKPRIAHPRRLIIVPLSPVDLMPGTWIRLTIRQEDAPNDMMPLVINRGRYSISGDEQWVQLANSESFRSRRDEIAQLVKEQSEIPSVELPLMTEQQPDLRRATAKFIRGNWLDKSGIVTPNIPKLFGHLPDTSDTNRLTLANWLVSPENPLTARVAVNRFWEQLFGTGIVETLEDFGPSGQAPSHPKLLDFLALRFRDDFGWDVKKLLREIVLSATYRQTNKVSPVASATDPRNRLLSHGPRTRLSAEMVRDNALFVSGLLSSKMYGSPVMPPQPKGLGKAARSSVAWKTSEGEDRNRRALYTLWRRSIGYPSIVTFDTPGRLICSSRRITTNTPLQALTTLNDPVYIDCALALARRMSTEVGDDPETQISHGYLLATGRTPSAEDLKDLRQLRELALKAYQESPELSKHIAETPEISALTLVANAILNLDAVLTK